MSCLPFMMMLGLNQGDNIVTQQEDLGDTRTRKKGGSPHNFFSLHACVALIYAALKLIFNYLPFLVPSAFFHNAYGIVSYNIEKEPFSHCLKITQNVS